MAHKDGVMMSFTNKIQNFFPSLFEKWGFELVSLVNDYDGNVVVAQSDKLRMRFIQDRADFFVDLGRTNEPDKWIGFYEIMDQLKASGIVNVEYKYANKIRAVSRLLDQYFPEIRNILSE